MKVYRLAEAEAEAAKIKAENSRSADLMALETERLRLEKMPTIISEMVKPAEKIKGININQVTGLGRGGDGETSSATGQAISSILDMAISLPAMKKIGDQIGLNLDGLNVEGEKGVQK